ncbi:hypothetical protein CPB85DRAFT_1559026, partial [Mucidula mucida]
MMMTLFTNLSTPNPETQRYMMRAQYPIPGVVASGDVSSITTSEWLITGTPSFGSSTLHDRQKKRSIARELILLHMRSKKDTRFIRLERFIPLSTQLKTDTLGDTSTDSLFHDKVEIGDSIQSAIGDGYDLVQAFAVQRNLNVIDVAALAFAITHSIQNYLSHHMSMWWAATFFAVAHRMANDPPGTQGPAFKDLGKIYGIPFVNERCCLFQHNTCTIEVRAVKIHKCMRDEKMDPALIENFIASLSSDLSLLSNLDEDFSLRTISHLRSSAEATSAVTRVFLKGIVRSAVMKQDDGNEVSLARQETEELGEPIGVAEAIRRETVELRREAIEFRREAVEVRREAAELKKAAVEFKREALGARKEAQQTAQCQACGGLRLGVRITLV